MRSVLLATIGLTVLPPTATLADDLVAIRPGLQCASANALARLTPPDGESRSHAVAPRPSDLAAARMGGCTDIVLGTIVTVLTARHDTSVIARPGSSPVVVANIDVEPLPDRPQPPDRDGYATIQHLLTGGPDGEALEVLEDDRITPTLRRQMWGVAEDPAFVLDAGSPLLKRLASHPLLKARLRLVAGTGAVISERKLDQLQAIVGPAPLHGLPAPAFLLTVDDSIGMGSYAGRVTTLLVPSQRRLDAVQATAPDGTAEPMHLGDTLKTLWRVVPPRIGQTEEIELAACRPQGSKPGFVTTYATYRFTDGRWRVASRRTDGITELDEGFPARSMFP